MQTIKHEACEGLDGCGSDRIIARGHVKSVLLVDQIVRTRGRQCLACGRRWQVVVHAVLTGFLRRQIEGAM